MADGASDGDLDGASDIRALALDVDGVLTDGGVWWGEDGSELKRFSFADIMGVSLASKAGLIVTLISGEDSPLVDRFAAKMNITDVTKGCKDKAAALRAFAERRGLPLGVICFMGDDVNDLKAMEIAGFSAAPANAQAAVLRVARFVAKANGGNGAVRELVDMILAGETARKIKTVQA
jgi:3-deoxy-D-manno-octulosonate 8-phosphate phosphatase (KDO 8-P phosphatase)